MRRDRDEPNYPFVARNTSIDIRMLCSSLAGEKHDKKSDQEVRGREEHEEHEERGRQICGSW